MKIIRQPLLDINPSDTLAINELCQEKRKNGEPVYNFGFGQSPFPVPDIIQQSLRLNAFQKDYLPIQGLPELREQIARHTNDLVEGVKYDDQNVFIGPGSKQLLFSLQFLLEAPLFLPSPSWVSYAPQAQMLNKKVFWIPADETNWKVTARDIEKCFIDSGEQSGILFLNYPSNPTGQQLSGEELNKIATVCRNHQIIILSDEIYGELSYDLLYRSVASYYPEGTIITSGLSKWCGAGGWRLGYALMPNELFLGSKVLKAIASETFSSVSAPIQFAGVTAYTPHYEINEYKRKINQVLAALAAHCYSVMKSNDIHCVKTTGGFYSFPNFQNYGDQLKDREITTSPGLCQRLLQDTGVALLPGTAFGRPEDELTARLAFVDFDGEQVLSQWQQSDTNDQLRMNQLFPKVMQGLEAMINWVKK